MEVILKSQIKVCVVGLLPEKNDVLLCTVSLAGKNLP